MKFLQIATFYDFYLSQFYRLNPTLSRSSFDVQLEHLSNDAFSAVYNVAPYLRDYGYEVKVIVANALSAQSQWAKEYNSCLDPSVDGYRAVVKAQIEWYKPDVIYFLDTMMFDSSFIASLSWKPSLILGWRAADISTGINWSGYDVILSGLSNIRKKALDLGARYSEVFLPGFPEWLCPEDDMKKTSDIVFVGQWDEKKYPKRTKYLTMIADFALLNKFKCDYYLSGDGIDDLPSVVNKCNHSPKFGISMQKVLKTGKIAFDARGKIGIGSLDLGAKETSNMRLFEATGVGSFLLTEKYDNLQNFFDIGEEIEVYSDEEELLRKIKYYLSHDRERENIARSGKTRCLAEHSMSIRAKELDSIIRRYL